LKDYLFQFDGKWKTIKRLIYYSPTCFEIICTTTPVAGIRCEEEVIKDLEKEPGIIAVEEDCNGYLCNRKEGGK
jgi:hypothetical protein